ncbi:DUF2987 domain-containing protein [Psychromonas sp. L1A2]|uniref:DUF2987 domain-containing protein n=1 Tax=Psychromonas sp. L1A2 TaxID=2686356 RepID=UPI001357A3FE|nr:DUF2987 domain-containing protein [Psychromonas sp. L1A2]
MRLLLVVSLMLFSSFSQASTIKLNYSVFFSYMKTMYKLDYPYVTTAFYLVDSENQSLCHINNAEIVVEEVNEPILFQPEGRLLPFYSDQHRQDGAVLVVDLDDGKTLSNCNLQITVMAKERELSNLNEKKLMAISEQLEGVLKKNAGMIGKYFLPEFAGVRLTLTSPLTEPQLNTLGNQISIASNGDLLLKKDSFNIINKINELNLLLKRITPWMLNNNPN